MRHLVTAMVLAAVVSAQQAPIGLQEIRPALTEIRDVIIAEYGILLLSEPEAAGIIELSLTVDPGGSLSDVGITCDPVLKPVADAALEAVNGLSFGPGLFAEPIDISVPFSCVPPSGS